MLDFSFLGYQKRITKYKIKSPNEFSNQSKQIIKIVSRIYRSIDPFIMVISFRQADVMLVDLKDGIQRVRIYRSCTR